MNDVAAADDQHAFVAQRREMRAERVMKRRRLRGVDRELHDRHVRLRKRMLEHGPGAVVEAPGLIEADIDGREELADASGECGVAGCRILHVEQRLRKAVEIVDGLWLLHGGYRRAGGVPVRGDRENRFRFTDPRAELPPRLGVTVALERIHRAAVSEENRRHAGGGLARHRKDP